MAKSFCFVAGIVSGIILAASLKAYLTPVDSPATQMAEGRDAKATVRTDIVSAPARAQDAKKKNPSTDSGNSVPRSVANSAP